MTGIKLTILMFKVAVHTNMELNDEIVYGALLIVFTSLDLIIVVFAHTIV